MDRGNETPTSRGGEEYRGFNIVKRRNGRFGYLHGDEDSGQYFDSVDDVKRHIDEISVGSE